MRLPPTISIASAHQSRFGVFRKIQVSGALCCQYDLFRQTPRPFPFIVCMTQGLMLQNTPCYYLFPPRHAGMLHSRFSYWLRNGCAMFWWVISRFTASSGYLSARDWEISIGNVHFNRQIISLESKGGGTAALECMKFSYHLLLFIYS